MTSWKAENFGPRWACPIGASGSQLELTEFYNQKTPATLRRAVNQVPPAPILTQLRDTIPKSMPPSLFRDSQDVQHGLLFASNNNSRLRVAMVLDRMAITRFDAHDVQR